MSKAKYAMTLGKPTSRFGFGARRSSLACLLFIGFTTPFGIAAHLLSELAGLGWHDDADVLFSPRHGYLALLAVAALASLLVALLSVPRQDRRERIASLIADLPFRGRGARFALLSFAAQFGVFAATQLGEGCPLCNGDVVVGVFAAAVAAALGAVVVALGKRKFLDFALSLIHYVGAASGSVAATLISRLADRGTSRTGRRRSPFAFRYRPPPVAA
jgi:hypothetical protein